MRETEIIERSFLQQLRAAAEGMASGNLNPTWARAYLNLADAVDKLDAMQARCEVSQPYCKSPQTYLSGSSDPENDSIQTC